MPSKKYQFWILTIPYADWKPPTDLSNYEAAYIAGQRELSDTGYDHWQLVAYYAKERTLGIVKADFTPTAHCEPTRSKAARDYVWKDDTAVADSRFELGKMPFRRNSKVDWEAVRTAARAGRLDDIPANIYVQHYNSLKRIAADNQHPAGLRTTTRVFVGPTGVGKSRRTWFEAGTGAYPKDPRTKWWCGYQGQQNVIIDEFRGDIGLSHMLRWLDRYPVILETKGCSIPKSFTNVWIMSNLHPRDWYPDIDEPSKLALYRRLEIVEMNEQWTPPAEDNVYTEDPDFELLMTKLEELESEI